MAVYGVDVLHVTGTGVGLVDVRGAVVNDTRIRLTRPITDYNTRFSGIDETDLVTGPEVERPAEIQLDWL